MWTRVLTHWKNLKAGLVSEDYVGGASHAVFVARSAVLRSEVCPINSSLLCIKLY
jgi:hypothetical protein